jgi:hypothetical protein
MRKQESRDVERKLTNEGKTYLRIDLEPLEEHAAAHLGMLVEPGPKQALRLVVLLGKVIGDFALKKIFLARDVKAVLTELRHREVVIHSALVALSRLGSVLAYP